MSMRLLTHHRDRSDRHPRDDDTGLGNDGGRAKQYGEYTIEDFVGHDSYLPLVHRRRITCRDPTVQLCVRQCLSVLERLDAGAEMT